jgi:signal transduction histidine kinase
MSTAAIDAATPAAPRVRARTTRLALIAGAGLLATAATAWACARSPILYAPAETAVWRSAFVASYIAVGVYSWWRRPESRLGPLVAGVGFLYGVASLNAAAAPLAYTLGMVVWISVIVYLAYVFLCFPRGRLESRIERNFILALVVSTAVVWGLILALSPDLPRGGPFTNCGSRCPPNALQIVSGNAATGDALNTAFNVLTTMSLIGLAMLIWGKARSAAYISRRAMTPVTVAFLANIVEFVMYLFIGPAYPETKEAFRLADGVVTMAVPFAMLAGQVRGQAFVASSLSQLVVRAGRGPMTPAAVEKTIGEALGDPGLRVALWDREAGAYVDVHAAPLEPPLAGGAQATTQVTRGGLPVAVLIHDRALHIDTGVAEDLAATSVMLLENWHLVQELRASRSRVVKAAEHERRRLERDLHDGAQQSLMAIQLRARFALDATEPEDTARQLAAIEREAAAALEELRELAHGIYPPILTDLGLPAALQAVARRSSIPIQVSSAGIGRYREATEAAVYFCAREAIQNAAKHAGVGAQVIVTLASSDQTLQLTVSDDGVGMPLDRSVTGLGLLDMRDRIEAVGGHFEVASKPGGGTSIRVSVPTVQS